MIKRLMKRPSATGRAALFAAVALSSLAAAAPALALPPIVTAVAPSEIPNFYRARAERPLWLADKPAATALIALLKSAALDKVDAATLDLAPLDAALAAADGGEPQAVARADALLSDRFVRYARATRTIDPQALGFEIADPRVRPTVPSASILLRDAGAAPSLTDYVRQMRWMNQNYAPLRSAIAAATKAGDARLTAQLRVNMQRVRLLPDQSTPRYLMVNIPAQRLEMVEYGKVVDSMRVIVGKPEMPTPTLGSMMYYVAVNPYWNVPTDLVSERVAPNVLKEGLNYIKKKGYYILSDWSDHPTVVDPTTIDWKQVQAGKVVLRMRQDPGDTNAMGHVKFPFPNVHGVYLHDTPQKELLTSSVRMFSAGCVRLEAAPRLSQWLLGSPLNYQGQPAEQFKSVVKPVPVFLAYLTAVPSATGGQVAYLKDSYGRDTRGLAELTKTSDTAAGGGR